ncbi:lipid II-degrading bacteriocin [Pseudomonas lutea]|uniref:Lipid II-degrading bacteriocin n=2 Tax=cellular organisms TaxID=131567 RepID=A0ABR9A0T6_9PSED|nr:lipid II-degrading bacteriocin [Pseudomonas lutea]MBD8119667.1 lipid II-degrading bacteriocin [Pseudomonas lutea]
MNGITLPNINVTAKSPRGSAGNKGNSGGPPLPPHVLKGATAIKRSKFYIEGNWQEMINGLLDRVAYNPTLAGPLREDLYAAHHADQYMCLKPNTRPADAWLKGLNKASVRGEPLNLSENELSGGLFSPVKALAHALSGDGTTLHVNILNIGIKPSPANMPMLKNMIDNAQIGSSPINIDRVGYNTGADSGITGAYLGNITLKITGIVHKHDSQHYTFAGDARAYHDVYDANASSHRSWLTESATTALRTIMDNEKAKPYAINISGALPLTHSQ